MAAVTRVATPGACRIVVYIHKDTGRTMDAHGFTVTCCGKCGGHGHLAGYEFSDGARCWRCNARGYYYTPAVLRERSAFVADLKAKRPVDISANWRASRSRVEPDVAEVINKQIAYLADREVAKC
jgi:hypothetical protein